MRLSRCEVRDHINYRKNYRWPSYRFYSALQRLKSPMRDICEIFGARRFSTFSTISAISRHLPPTQSALVSHDVLVQAARRKAYHVSVQHTFLGTFFLQHHPSGGRACEKEFNL
jgi:hypothetical protein